MKWRLFPLHPASKWLVISRTGGRACKRFTSSRLRKGVSYGWGLKIHLSWGSSHITLLYWPMGSSVGWCCLTSDSLSQNSTGATMLLYHIRQDLNGLKGSSSTLGVPVPSKSKTMSSLICQTNPFGCDYLAIEHQRNSQLVANCCLQVLFIEKCNQTQSVTPIL